MQLRRAVLEKIGIVVAPWFYLVGRFFKNLKLLQTALRLDPQLMRAAQLLRRLENGANLDFDRLNAALALAANCRPAAATTILRNLSWSEGQLLQDLLCLVVHNEKRNGYFVEVGVGDGIAISNSCMLEKQFGWSGILVEPSRGFHNSITSNRSALLEKRAAGRVNDTEVEFEELILGGEFSRITGLGVNRGGDEKTHYKVKLATLDRILSEAGAPKAIDFMSIDTEGNELDILDGLDLTVYKIGLFAIEHNFRPGMIEGLNERLLPHGYRRILANTSAFDAWFIHNDTVQSNIG